jgi:RimJ/RimL family protein N-acetyltransferase
VAILFFRAHNTIRAIKRKLMNNGVKLETERLILRGLENHDAKSVYTLAGAPEVAAMTLNIPHPYPKELAYEFINFSQRAWRYREHYNFAITLIDADDMIGCIGLTMNPDHNRAELGYWMGKPYWNKGYTTEAARCVIQFGFENLELNKIHAMHFPDNPASGRVLQKCAMTCEGILRAHVIKDGDYHDVNYYGIVRDDYLGNNGNKTATEG